MTTANLSTNPRFLKELLLAKSQGIVYKAIAFRLGGWSDENDPQLIQQHGLNLEYISATRSPFFAWFTSSLVQQVCEWLNLAFKNNLLINAFASSKRTFLLFMHMRKVKGNFDLVIAHTHGAFYPASFFSQKNKIPLVLDIEDFHPGENCSLAERYRREFLFERIVSKSNFIYQASPLIEKATLKLLKTPVTSLVINNVFSKDDFSFKNSSRDKIGLVWFSQHISAGRGLELVVPSIYEKRADFQLVLIGNLNQKFYEKFLQHYSDCLVIKQPMNQSELNAEICNYDVGLALEPGKDENNLIAVSNKIWAYYQAGLFILATSTPAQVLFMNERPEHGSVTKQSTESIDSALSDIIKKIVAIRAGKQERYLRASQYSWEEEQTKLLQIWKSAVQKKAS